MQDRTVTEAPALPAAVLEKVSALAAVDMTVPVANSRVDPTDKAGDKPEGERVTKWARKKEKMTCYRCGEQGHFVVVCKAELCDFCRKLKHESGDCPTLSLPKPVVTMYGVCCPELMFFESPKSSTQVPESTKTGVVKVTRGTMTTEQIIQRL